MQYIYIYTYTAYTYTSSIGDEGYTHPKMTNLEDDFYVSNGWLMILQDHVI